MAVSEGFIDWANLVPGVRVGFTKAGPDGQFNLAFHAGGGNVPANRRRLEAALPEPGPIVWMSQVHGSHVAAASDARLTPAGFLSVGEADGVVVTPGQTAAVMVADCIPVILARQDATAAAAVHVGRRGLELGIAPKAVAQLGGEVSAYVGPSICGKCYEVPGEMAQDFALRIPETRSLTRWGTPALDLRAGLAAQLANAGVKHVKWVDTCTFESSDYFSHRRTVQQGAPEGRFVGVVQVETRPGKLP